MPPASRSSLCCLSKKVEKNLMTKICRKLLPFLVVICCGLVVSQAQTLLTAPATPNFWPQWAQNAQHTSFLTSTVGQPLNQNAVNLVYDFNVAAEQADPNALGGLSVHYQVPLVDGNDVFIESKDGTYSNNTYST